MKEIVLEQREFFNSNQTKDVAFRIAQLKKLKSLIKENEKSFDEAIFTDFKKSAFDNFTCEMALVYHDLDEAIKNVKKWSAKKPVKTNLLNQPGKSYVVPEPLGVSLVIGAWNYPFQLSFAPVIAAMAAGNTVVLKPSELPQNTSRIMAQVVNENFDPAYFTVVEGGVAETTELLAQKFDKIFFTGSVPVGKIVYQAAAKNLTPVTLELGGKSPAIIEADCDLPITVKRLVWAKFLNAGQTCIAPDYILVQESIKDLFLQKMVEEIEKEKFDVTNGNYVQIINQRNTERLASMIDKEKVYSGGKVDIEKRIIQPTILSDVTWEDKIMQDEIFGPILPVLTYRDLSEAISQIKAHPRPLSCYIFTKNNRTKERVLNEISFGGGAVNEAIMHIANSSLPFGGVGNSGIGAYHGEAGFRTFSHYKSILEKPTWFEPSLKYFPHTKKKLNLIKWIMGQR
ncbi:aldehyde dehydrogenase [Namhaeicola litoreus]|uniref:Aldehyde dehydrogenase n=1 Tax=Namhaeicola litoreus TaxID=1052145 RepID=A0ABW3Y0X8_9FLAO